jgi:hypothetical protein
LDSGFIADALMFCWLILVFFFEDGYKQHCPPQAHTEGRWFGSRQMQAFGLIFIEDLQILHPNIEQKRSLKMRHTQARGSPFALLHFVYNSL